MVGNTGMSAGRNRKVLFTFTHTQISGRFPSFLTEFDGETGRELHLNELPEFIKVLEGRDHLQNIQQPGERERARGYGREGCTEARRAGANSRLDAQREVLAHGHRGFKVLLALFADQLPAQMRRPEETQTSHQIACVIQIQDVCPKAGTRYFSWSAEAYSSQEIVFGDGGVRDCLLTG